MIKALIFDCWGTLFTSSLHPHPFELFAQKLGYSIKNRDFLKLFEYHIMTNDNPVSKNITSLLFELEIETNQDLINDLTDIMLGSLPAQIPYDDTIKTLNKLKDKYRLFLLSNTFKEGFVNLRSNYPIDNIFELIILSYEENIIKPNNKLYEIILNKTGLKHDEIIMIGDNYHDDIVAANNSGIQAILIDRRGRYPEISDNRINNLSTLKQLL